MRAPRTWTVLLALVTVIGLASCERVGHPPDRLTGADPIVQPQAAAVVSGDDGQQYTLIQDHLPIGIPSLQLSKLIGVGGGQITLAGHTLAVPAGAVAQPTLFTMRLVPDGYIEVELIAVGGSLLNRLLNVGSQGFSSPVSVSLTFARALNVTNPQELKILRLQGDRLTGTHEVLESHVNEQQKTVQAELDHFSRFCMAEG